MAFWIGLGAAGCGVDDSQAKLQATLQAQTAENGDLQRQLGELRAEVEDLRKRKDVIYTVRMRISFPDLQGPAGDAGALATSFLTEAKLAASDGTTYRLLGRSSPGSATPSELIYEPIDPSAWMAHPISSLRRLEKLTLDFPASFNAAGITWGEAPRLHARFEVNGVEAVDLDAGIDLATARAGQPLTLNVHDTFERVSENYTRELNRHAG